MDMATELVHSNRLYPGVHARSMTRGKWWRRVTSLVAAWNEVAAGFGEHDPPSTLVGVTVLGYPDQLVEIEAIAVGAQR